MELLLQSAIVYENLHKNAIRIVKVDYVWNTYPMRRTSLLWVWCVSLDIFLVIQNVRFTYRYLFCCCKYFEDGRCELAPSHGFLSFLIFSLFQALLFPLHYLSNKSKTKISTSSNVFSVILMKIGVIWALPFVSYLRSAALWTEIQRVGYASEQVFWRLPTSLRAN